MNKLLCPLKFAAKTSAGHDTNAGNECDQAQCAWWVESHRLCAVPSITSNLLGLDDRLTELINIGGSR